MENEEIVEEKKERSSSKRADIIKEKIKIWLKDPYNFIFILILIFAVGIRLYYFSMTKNQPIWWDEADYMAYAKTLAGYTSQWTVTGPHSTLFPIYVAVLFKIGFSEAATRFILGVLPSIFLVILAYFTCNLMYKDKRIGLICAILMTAFWDLLFFSMRFHLEGPALMFGLMAMYSYWKGFEKKEKIFGKIDHKWGLSLAIVFIVLTYGTRRGYFLFGVFFLAYFLLTADLKKQVKNKYNWIGLIIGIFIFLLIEKFVFVESIATSYKFYSHVDKPVTFAVLQTFKPWFENINGGISSFYYLFLIGAVLVLINLFLSYDSFRKQENKESRADLFVILTFVVTISYFAFYQRDQAIGEVRWYYPMLFGSFIMIAKATLFIADNVSAFVPTDINKYKKYVAFGIILILMAHGANYELKHADMIIKNKVNSFNGVKQVGLFLKEIAPQDAIIMGLSNPQISYYAERKGRNPSVVIGETKLDTEMTLEEFLEGLRKEENINAKYLYVTFSEPNQPDWMRHEEYIQDPNTGQVRYSKWIISFANTTIDFLTGQHDIKEKIVYDDIEFRLLKIIDDAFLYEVIRLDEVPKQVINESRIFITNSSNSASADLEELNISNISTGN